MPLMPGTKILDNETKRLIFTDLLINICWLLVFSLSGEIKADQVWTFFLSCVSVGSLQEQPVRWRTQLGDEQQQQQQADRCSFEAPLEGSAFRTHVGGVDRVLATPCVRAGSHKACKSGETMGFPSHVRLFLHVKVLKSHT